MSSAMSECASTAVPCVGRVSTHASPRGPRNNSKSSIRTSTEKDPDHKESAAEVLGRRP